MVREERPRTSDAAASTISYQIRPSEGGNASSTNVVLSRGTQPLGLAYSAVEPSTSTLAGSSGGASPFGCARAAAATTCSLAAAVSQIWTRPADSAAASRSPEGDHAR